MSEIQERQNQRIIDYAEANFSKPRMNTADRIWLDALQINLERKLILLV